jgi:hypothetical protein
MSQESVRRDIADKRAYAAMLERRANDPAHPINDGIHREHLLDEARKARAQADAAEARLQQRSSGTALPH